MNVEIEEKEKEENIGFSPDSLRVVEERVVGS